MAIPDPSVIKIARGIFLAGIDDLLGSNCYQIKPDVGYVDQSHCGQERTQSHRRQGFKVCRFDLKSPQNTDSNQDDLAPGYSSPR